jgi:hypothetical protein
VTTFRERLAMIKQTRQRVHVQMFNLKTLNDVEGKEQYRIEISNVFADLENLDTAVNNNRARETIREHIKNSAKESMLL